MTKKIKIIDLFAGPGGLGEGFSNCTKNSPFSIAMSVEKETSAHATLTLRSFLRKFRDGKLPLEYIDYLRENDKKKKPVLKAALIKKYPKQWTDAEEETLGGPRALGTGDNRLIFDRLDTLKQQHKGPWLVIGGPPCQAYSLAGRSRNMGVEDYDAKEDHRHFLYKEYMKVLDVIRPEVFVMENVKGILSAKVDGEKMFPTILSDLRQPSLINNDNKGPEYKIYSLVKPSDTDDLLDEPSYKNHTDFIIRSEEYGVPQARHRVILLGVRDDIKAIPDQLETAQGKISVKDMINSMPALRSGLSKEVDTAKNWESAVNKAIDKLEKLPKKHQAISDAVATFKNGTLPISRGGIFCKSSATGFSQSANKRKDTENIINWIRKPGENLGGFTNHETRGHMTADLARYLFCAIWPLIEMKSPSPKSADFPASLAPNHANWKSGAFADRFRCQAGDKPATTITSHISKDGHYFIHPDPIQCRSLTVREAARLQTFPDNYLFEGNRTQQYVQVGNAVPPYLAKQIAEIVAKILT